MKKVAILQSNYIPWKGYFDLINLVDVFVLYDDMQYTKRDWRNRNIIKTINGPQWLTISVETKGKYNQKINQTQVSNPDWVDDHLRRLQYSYAKAPYYKHYKPKLEAVYNTCKDKQLLSDINYEFIKFICDELGIKTQIIWSHDLNLVDGKTERLVGVCKELDAQYYLSGPAAKDYIDNSCFEEANIQLDYMDYSNYPVYQQIHGEFEHGVTILDLLFNEGPNSTSYMKSF